MFSRPRSAQSGCVQPVMFPKDYLESRGLTPSPAQLSRPDDHNYSGSRHGGKLGYASRFLTPLKADTMNQSGGGRSGDSHLKDALTLALTIASRFQSEGRGVQEEEKGLLKELIHVAGIKESVMLSPSNRPLSGQRRGSEQAMDGENPLGNRDRFGSMNKRTEDLFTKLRQASAASGIYKEMIASKSDLESLSRFAINCASTIDTTALTEMLLKEINHLGHDLDPVVYIKDAVEEALINPVSNVDALFSLSEGASHPLACVVSKKEPFDGDNHVFFPICVEGEFLGVVELEGVDKLEELDEKNHRFVKALIGIAALSFRNVRLFENVKWQSNKAEAMLTMANRLSRDNLDQDVLVESIMRTARQLTDSDRCSVFLVQDDQLKAYFDEGQSVTMPSDLGIAGHVSQTGETVNIPDAYNDSRFNASVDKATGYKTKSILCMPVRYEGVCVAVAQLINKLPRKKGDASIPRVFTKRDEELFFTFSTFVGVCLRNCRVNTSLVQEKRKSELTLDCVKTLSDSDIRDVQTVVEKVMKGAKQLLNADRSSLFLIDKERNELYSKIADSTGGKEIRFPSGRGIAGTVAASGVAENIEDAYTDPRFNREIDKQLGYRTLSILCEPITCKGEVLAVAQLVNKMDPKTGQPTKFQDQDQDTFKTYAMFAGISLSNSHLLEFAIKAGQEAMALSNTTHSGRLTRTASMKEHHVISNEELISVKDVKVAPEFFTTVSSRNFSLFAVRETSSSSYDAATAVIVSLIMSSGLPEKFKCTQETLTNFVLQCRFRYRKVPYHNFFHAVDVCQTVHTYLFEGKASEYFTELEQFVLLITALVHDLDHMGVNNSFHMKTDSPLGILSSASGNNSVLEVHHCNLAIEILEDAGANVFGGVGDELPTAYRRLIDCVLATDMARHGELLGNFESMCERGFDAAQSDDRKLAMQMLLKAADISNVTKPFEISRLWGVCVTEEFYQQGDKEREKGVDVLPMFDRTKGNELAKGQLGFINFLAKKFFVACVTKLFGGMQWCIDNIEDNVKHWEMLQAGSQQNPVQQKTKVERSQSIST